MEQESVYASEALVVEDVSLTHLMQVAGWARFLSIMGFVGSGLLAIGGISMIFLTVRIHTMGAGNIYSSRASSAAAGRVDLLAFCYFAGAALYFFRCLLLYRFADKLKYSLDVRSQEDLTMAFHNLKKMFRYTGILTIVVVALYLVIFFAAMVAALNR